MNRYQYRGILFLFVIFTVFAFGQFKAEAGILQIGDNAYETIYSLEGMDNGGKVIWTAFCEDEDDLEVFLYSEDRTKRLTDNQVTDQSPVISNGQVAWVETRWNSYMKIKLFDGENNQQIAYFPGHSGGNVDFDNGQMVWGCGEILYYNNGKNILSRPTHDNNVFPRIEGGKIVWEDENSLYLYDGNTTRTITNNATWCYKLSEGCVAWYSFGSLYLDDGNRSRKITENGSRDFNLSGNNIVWSRLEDFDEEIFYYNGQTIIKLTNNNYNDYNPQIDNGKIAWVSHEGVNYQIYLWDGTNAKLLVNTPKRINNLLLKNGRLAWSSNNKIMLYEPSYDATARKININGNDLAGFNSSTYTYNIELPYGTATIPTVTVTAKDPNANIVITPANSLPGVTKIKIIAEDGVTTKTYKVYFAVSDDVTYYEWDKPQNPVSIDKPWTICFNSKADLAALNDENIFIKRVDGTPIEIYLEPDTDGASVLVRPVHNYEAGQSYCLYITNVKSETGKTLNRPVKMEFIINNN